MLVGDLRRVIEYPKLGFAVEQEAPGDVYEPASPLWAIPVGQWLSLPTHLPHGRPTLINRTQLADPRRSRRTVELLVRQYYGRSPHWAAVRDVLEAVCGH